MLGLGHRVLCVLGKHCTAELDSQPLASLFHSLNNCRPHTKHQNDLDPLFSWLMLVRTVGEGLYQEWNSCLKSINPAKLVIVCVSPIKSTGIEISDFPLVNYRDSQFYAPDFHISPSFTIPSYKERMMFNEYKEKLNVVFQAAKWLLHWPLSVKEVPKNITGFVWFRLKIQDCFVSEMWISLVVVVLRWQQFIYFPR